MRAPQHKPFAQDALRRLHDEHQTVNAILAAADVVVSKGDPLVVMTSLETNVMPRL